VIWVAGELVPDEALSISVLDRTFEHGLGLFETFRTWNGRASTLSRQCGRLLDSAGALGLAAPAPGALPGQDDVERLKQAEGLAGDVALRLAMSGGSDRTRPVVWLRTRPLSPPVRPGGALIRATWRVEPSDPLLAHKTLNYWRRRLAYEDALRAGFDEDLALDPAESVVYEGTRTNLFVVRDDVLHTPAACGVLLPGVMRALVLERAQDLGFRGVESEEWGLPLASILNADEVFLTNSVRGIIPVGRCVLPESAGATATIAYIAPGPWTARLWTEVSRRLAGGGDA
jgi:branched-subunit amino acid aminotransferase/4-amino-4-deoxychorismate lyase